MINLLQVGPFQISIYSNNPHLLIFSIDRMLPFRWGVCFLSNEQQFPHQINNQPVTTSLQVLH
jgi:hypothetical protein